MHGCRTPNHSNTLESAIYIPTSQSFKIYIMVDLMEIFLSITSSIFVWFGLYIFIKVPLFHNHLMQIIYTIAGNFYGILICRLYVMISVFLNGQANSSMFNVFSCIPSLSLAEYARVGFMFGYFVALETMVIERFLAIYHLDTYEKNNYSHYIMLSVICQALGILIGTVVLYFDLVDVVVLTSISGLANIAFISFFQISESINYRLYKGSKPSKVGVYTLSERFQISENIRTTFIMKRITIMTFLLNSICQISVITSALSTNFIIKQATFSIFNFVIPINSILFVVIAMLSIDSWRKKSKKTLNKLFRKLTMQNKVSQNVQQPPVLRTLSGTRMNFSKLEERDLYFQSLSDSWNRTI